MKSAIKIQISITIAAITIAAIHILLPNLKIDTITLALVIVAVVPWLAPLFKNIELPGGLKFEFQELERVKQEAKAAGLIDETTPQNQTAYTFLDVAETNPEFALAGLRLELEKSLRILAKQEGVGDFKRYGGASFLIRDLHKKEIISNQEKAALADMIGTLNRAIHGQELDHRATQWVIDIGPQILDSLNKRLKTSANNE